MSRFNCTRRSAIWLTSSTLNFTWCAVSLCSVERPTASSLNCVARPPALWTMPVRNTSSEGELENSEMLRKKLSRPAEIPKPPGSPRSASTLERMSSCASSPAKADVCDTRRVCKRSLTVRFTMSAFTPDPMPSPRRFSTPFAEMPRS